MNLITDQEINRIADGLLKSIQSQNNSYDSVHSPDKCASGSLVFISSIDLLQKALLNKAAGLIIFEKNFPEMKKLIPTQTSVWTTSNIQQAMSRILELFDQKGMGEPNGIHPTAIIHPDAQVSEKALVGPYAVVQQFAIIKEYTKIGSHTVIEAYAEVGTHTLVNPHVVVGSFCKIGNHCIIASHVTIGSDGFGFFTDSKGHHKIPQIGQVIIEDHCEIGAGSAIDRGTLEQTLIKRGSKLDNHCHIAHNVEIGENALLAAAFKVAGSTKIGRNLMSAGNIDINGHIEICENVILTGRTGVVSSIKEPGIYGGFPAEPHRDNIKNMASLSHLNKMRKHVQKIMKHLKLEE